MTNVFKMMVSAIQRTFSSPDRSPKVTVSSVCQVPVQRPPDLPCAHNSTIRHQVGLIRRNPLPDWQERDWQRHGDVYEGTYQVNGKSYKGIAERTEIGFDFFIFDPPKYRCFLHRGNGRFFVHPHEQSAQTVSSGLMSVEDAIRKALEERRKSA
jgi:hypothetical protein